MGEDRPGILPHQHPGAFQMAQIFFLMKPKNKKKLNFYE